MFGCVGRVCTHCHERFLAGHLLDYPAFIGSIVYIGQAVKNALNEFLKKSERSHYEVSRLARKERAYRIVHRLQRDGIFIKNTDPGRRQKWIDWDAEVIQAVVDNCNQNALQFYLTRAGRSGEGDATSPINEREYDQAISTLDMFIQDDFIYFLK